MITNGREGRVPRTGHHPPGRRPCADAGRHVNRPASNSQHRVRGRGFFKATFRNEHTPRAYGRIPGRFLTWCDRRELELRQITPGLAGEYISQLAGSASTKNQALASGISSTPWPSVTRSPSTVRLGARRQMQHHRRQDGRARHRTGAQAVPTARYRSCGGAPATGSARRAGLPPAPASVSPPPGWARNPKAPLFHAADDKRKALTGSAYRPHSMRQMMKRRFEDAGLPDCSRRTASA
jgi:hypothetical protein